MAADPLIALIAETLGVDTDELNEDSGTENTKNWNSLRQVVLMSEIESRYDIELSIEEISEAISVRRIRDLLAVRGAAATG